MPHLFSTTASLPRRNYDAKWRCVPLWTDLSCSSAEASTSSPPVKLQLLLHREWRTADGIEEVRKILDSLGITLTASGLATISADIEAERFESVFGVKATRIAARGPGAEDFGTSGGHQSVDLAVPAQLEKYVASISAAPPHSYLQN